MPLGTWSNEAFSTNFGLALQDQEILSGRKAKQMSKILIGEKDKELGSAIQDWFCDVSDFTSQVEHTGWRILECLGKQKFDAIIFDVQLPGIDGMTILRSYRAAGGCTPIILMAGWHNSEELRCGLDAGADGYLVQPFELATLAAMVRAVMRRPEMRLQKLLCWGGVCMDASSGSVSKDDAPIHLNPMEFKLLQFFLEHPNQAFSADALSERVWRKGIQKKNDTVRTHIRTLRQKIDSQGCPSLITTVRGIGYKTETPRQISEISARLLRPAS